MSAEGVTYAMRITQETKDLLQKLQSESGETQAEFFKRVATTLELEQLKEDGSSVEEIEELQSHTTRINEIMINLVGRSASIKNMCAQQLKDRESELTEKITSQAEQLSQLKTDKELLESLSRKNIEELLDAQDQLRETRLALGRANDLITEYKAKIEDLSVLAAENQRKASECDSLVLRVKELETKLFTANKDKAKADTLAEETQKKLTDINSQLEYEKAVTSKCKADLEQSERDKVIASREAAAQVREAVAEVREQYLSKVEEYQVRENKSASEIHRLQTELLLNQKQTDE